MQRAGEGATARTSSINSVAPVHNCGTFSWNIRADYCSVKHTLGDLLPVSGVQYGQILTRGSEGEHVPFDRIRVKLFGMSRQLAEHRIRTTCRELIANNGRVSGRALRRELRVRFGAVGKTARVFQIWREESVAKPPAPVIPGDMAEVQHRLQVAEPRWSKTTLERSERNFANKRIKIDGPSRLIACGSNSARNPVRQADSRVAGASVSTDSGIAKLPVPIGASGITVDSAAWEAHRFFNSRSASRCDNPPRTLVVLDAAAHQFRSATHLTLSSRGGTHA